MAEDYFDASSDAAFLALAEQLDNREHSGARSSRPVNSNGGNATVRRSAPETPTAPKGTKPTIAGASKPTARVSRPGFNAIIVNTRQVTYRV